jgi:hypothetical protein
VTGRPLEQADPELALETCDGSAQCLLRHEQSGGCPAEMKLFCDGHEGTQQSKIEVVHRATLDPTFRAFSSD